MEFLSFLVLLAGLLVLAVWLFIARQGDAEYEFIVDQRTDWTLVELTSNTAVFSSKIPFINKGTQDGTIMDAYPRHLLPQEQYDAVEVVSRLELESVPRTDGYWEALIVPKTTGGAVVLTVKFTAKDGNIAQDLAHMVDMPIYIVYQVVARSTWYINKSSRILITAEEIAQAVTSRHQGQEA